MNQSIAKYKTPENYKKVLLCQSIIRKWLITKYLNKIKPLIDKIMKKDNKIFVYEPTLFGDNSEKNIKTLKIAFKQKQKQMKEGEIAQIIIGNYIGWENLGRGHPSGLDCRKKDNKIIMDVKNKWNTCNANSQKTLFDKLSKYKKENSNTRCILAIINPKPGCKKLCKKIIHNNVEIEQIQGKELMKLVFTSGKFDYSKHIIEFIKRTMYKY